MWLRTQHWEQACSRVLRCGTSDPLPQGTCLVCAISDTWALGPTHASSLTGSSSPVRSARQGITEKLGSRDSPAPRSPEAKVTLDVVPALASYPVPLSVHSLPLPCRDPVRIQFCQELAVLLTAVASTGMNEPKQEAGVALCQITDGRPTLGLSHHLQLPTPHHHHPHPRPVSRSNTLLPAQELDPPF